MSNDTESSPSSRQLKTLVLTDLCDSVALVERLGDAAAAELFRNLDARVFVLLQQWRGRLIDRSDGMLLLFDSPTQGLGFALDYLDELQRLGAGHELPLRARIGIHVGYVLAWQNSEEAVAAGAKPLEVEGVAKPIAARLMALARPNQILMSAVAESLLRGGQRELGKRGADLRWKSHGHWYFKGLPAAQEVFEVGVPGRSPLCMPAGSSKARRALPLWRRPMALVAEVVLLAMLSALVWVLVRPEPAIAFGERDWIVVADFANNTGNETVNEALQHALRVSLEQSRYVNVLSDLKVRETLQQMHRDPTRPMDHDAAVELAVREGAKAVVMPSLVEVHGKLRVALDVIDPQSGRVVLSEHADGRGLESSLVSIDKVTAALRLKLGEALAEVGRNSQPLPKVATGSLDALRAYAIGLEAYAENRRDDAMGHFEQATRLDPEFAAAYIGQMRIAYSLGDFQKARELLAIAAGKRENLSARDRLYLDSWQSELSGSGPAEIAYRWKLLGDLYPDFHAAHANRSNALFSMGQYPEAEREARLATVQQNPLRIWAMKQMARTLLAQNKNAQALTSFQQVTAMGGAPDRELASAMAALDDYDGAQRVLRSIPEEATPAWLQRIAVAVDQGMAGPALQQAGKARALCSADEFVCSVFDLQALTLRLEAAKPADAAEFEKWLQSFQRQTLQSKGAERADWAFMTIATLHVAQRSGHDALVAAWLPRIAGLVEDMGDRRVRQMLGIVSAWNARPGQIGAVLAEMQAQVDGTELIQLHVLLQELQLRLGNAALAEQERQWLARQRGLAYSENAGTYALISLNVADVRRARLGLAH